MKLMYKPEKVISSFLAAFMVLSISLQPVSKQPIQAYESEISICGYNEEELPSIPSRPKPY